MRIFKNRWFARFAKKEGISDEKLIKAVRRLEEGSIDANYGGGVFKQRVARPEEGKSGGYRTIILFRKGDRAVFLYGFAKNQLENVGRSDIRDFKKLAKIMFSLSDGQITKLLNDRELVEVPDEEE